MGLETTTIIALASLAVGTASAYVAYRQGRSAMDARKKANEVAAAQAEVKKQQDIRDQIRAERVKRAQIMQAARDTGVNASSGQFGSTSALESQIGSNIGTISGEFGTNRSISRLNQQSADAASRQQTFSQISGLAMSGFQLFSDTPGFKKDTAKIFS